MGDSDGFDEYESHDPHVDCTGRDGMFDEADNVERDFYNGLLRIARRYAAEYAGLDASF
jgi:hypothetical protein